jgi:hypothetical protein
MLRSLAYLAFSAVPRLLVGRRRSEVAKDVELLVLRHELCSGRAACVGSGAGGQLANRE